MTPWVYTVSVTGRSHSEHEYAVFKRLIQSRKKQTSRVNNHALYLPLDVDHPVSVGLGLFGECTSLASDHPHRLVFLLEHVLRGVVQDEAHALFVGLKTKLLGNETDIYIGLVSALVS
jgi:hypothetical protein